MAWTEKQKQAIDHRGKNILVSAAAGSGKTSVLTERIKDIVLGDGVTPGVPISEILIVTFTEAAAGEMKQRIEAALSEKVSDGNEFAISQLRNIGNAKISTFHAFALSIIKKYYHAIDLDPSFKTCDENRASYLKNEAMDALFDAEFDKNSPEFIDFLNNYASAKNDNAVRNMIFAVHSFIMTLPDPFVWLDDAVREMGIPSMKFVDEEILYSISRAKDLLYSIETILEENGFDKLLQKNTNDFEIINGFEEAYLKNDYQAICDMLDSKFETFLASKAEKEGGYAEYSDLIKRRRENVKSILKSLRSDFFSKTKEEYAKEINHTAPFAATLKNLVRDFDEIYSSVKRAEGVIDFNDFQHMALKILDDEDIAADYRKNLSYIFIDEYQDSNYIQEALINRIKRDNNVFMVGDVKQSIYKFLNAEPALILGKYSEFPSDDKQTEKNIKIDLSSNFRSKSGVINAVNSIFRNIMEEHYSGMKYDENVALAPGLSYDEKWDKKTTLHIVSKGIADTKVLGEALVASDIIKDAIGKPFYDTKKDLVREVEYKDVVVILRAAKNSAEVFREVLEDNGIPSYTGMGEGYFETTEIDTFISLLSVIDNLRQDVPLVATMFSAVFGFSMTELVEIRACNMEREYYSAFLSYSRDGENDLLKQKCINMIEKIEHWRDEERFMRLDEFLWKLMRESGYYDYAGALLYGEQRQANLRALLDIASSFQNDRVRGLNSFLSYLSTIRDTVDMPQVKILAEGENVVRIMTIHKSKGLEFPVVIQCGLGDLVQGGGNNDGKVLLHRDIGLALDWEDYGTHTYKKTLLSKVVKQKIKLDEKAESIRLLYVGMTRAMDTLHLVGTVNDAEKYIAGYTDSDPEIDVDIARATTYLNLIMPTVVNEKSYFDIKTVTEEDICEEEIEGATPTNVDNQLILSRLGAIAEETAQMQEVQRRFEYEYPHKAAALVKSKYSVTSIVKMEGSKNKSAKYSENIENIHNLGVYYYTENSSDEKYEDAGLTSAEKGTAIHKALEILDFNEAFANRGNSDFFKNYLSALKENEILTSEEADSIDIRNLLFFSQSEVCKRAASSELLLKEVPFNMKLPYSEINVNGADDSNEEIIVQGIIDCIFEENGELVLVDYKSGYYSKDETTEEDRIKDTYSAQMSLYKKAAGLIFNKPVKESIIYMTRANAEIIV